MEGGNFLVSSEWKKTCLANSKVEPGGGLGFGTAGKEHLNLSYSQLFLEGGEITT